MSEHGVFSGPYFSPVGLNMERYEVFSRNAGNYGPEKTPYLDTFHAVIFASVFKMSNKKQHVIERSCISIYICDQILLFEKKSSSTCKFNKSNVTYTCLLKVYFTIEFGDSTCMICPLRCSVTSNCCLVISHFALEYKRV